MICRSNKEDFDIVMTNITDEEEDNLDRGKRITIKRGNKKFRLKLIDNVICYGKIDFNKYSDDMKQLEYIIPFTNIVHIPIDYNLETHSCVSPVKMIRTCECSNISDICRYNYGVLGKPDKVVIFKTR